MYRQTSGSKHHPTHTQVQIDHDAGTLAFGINNGQPCLALVGFPPGTDLRPFCGGGYGVDRFTFAPAYL